MMMNQPLTLQQTAPGFEDHEDVDVDIEEDVDDQLLNMKVRVPELNEDDDMNNNINNNNNGIPSQGQQQQLLQLLRNGHILSYIQSLKSNIHQLKREKKALRRDYYGRIHALAGSVMAKSSSSSSSSPSSSTEDAATAITEEASSCLSSAASLSSSSQSSSSQSSSSSPSPSSQSSFKQIKSERDELRKQCQEQQVMIGELQLVVKSLQQEQYDWEALDDGDEAETIAAANNNKPQTDLEAETLQSLFYHQQQRTSMELIRNDQDIMIHTLKEESSKWQTKADSLMVLFEQENQKYKAAAASTIQLQDAKERQDNKVQELEATIVALNTSNTEQCHTIQQLKQEAIQKEEYYNTTIQQIAKKMEQYEDENERLAVKCTTLHFAEKESSSSLPLSSSSSSVTSTTTSTTTTSTTASPSSSTMFGSRTNNGITATAVMSQRQLDGNSLLAAVCRTSINQWFGGTTPVNSNSNRNNNNNRNGGRGGKTNDVRRV